MPRRIGLPAATEISDDRDLEAAIAMSIPFRPQTPNQVGYHRGLIVANTSLSPSAWRVLQGEHGSSAPRAEVARTIWFASGLSGRHFLGDSHRHRNHLRCHGRALLGQDRGSLRPAAVVQALALQAMQFSAITIPEEPHPTSRACSRPTRFWAAPQLAARAPTVTAGGYLSRTGRRIHPAAREEALQPADLAAHSRSRRKERAAAADRRRGHRG